MKSGISKNLAIRSLWLFAAVMAMVIQTLLAHAQSYRVLYSFTKDSAAGQYPSSSLVRDPQGNLYGVALGGTYNTGIIFELSSTSDEKVLYNFNGSDGDGDVPDSMSFRDAAGDLFGTTFQGGAYSYGTVFKLDTQGRETVLYSFCPKTPCTDGAFPGGVIPSKNGTLYGITYAGGNFSCAITGCGTVFKINRDGDLTLLHAFGGADGQAPNAGLVLDASNDAYGTTQYGGVYGRGAVFKVTSAGNEIVEYSFGGGADGAYPDGGLVRDAEGNFYGTANQGGAYNYGTIFKITALGQFTVLYSFPGGVSGANPYADLNLDQQGNIFGVTDAGGGHNFGVVFRLDPSGNETVLHSFAEEADGVHPSGLIIDASGNLYGTTYQGGKHNHGSVFKVVP
ncbi:MAG TPA: choice-of-anchor tandem repeat GloVer-containing protein [Terriglobales bacterium]|jgi:uncharacterized repeat protein (TIGR03803 family)|nr:choice-of-anchor tandem repeat GloVer-containing protein [Terriglobales bacterium]